MRKVFSSNEVTEIVLIKDAIERQGIRVAIHNEYTGTSAAPSFRPPAEIWVKDEGDYDLARRSVVEALGALDSTREGSPWYCPSCGEENPHTFDLCWNCGLTRKEKV